VILEVADNGRGIQAEAVEKGIRGMRERASVVDAKLYLRTRPEGGTCLTLSVPT
jgi:signal transduction histidine kinase